MEIEIDLRKSLQENASAFFEKSKKAKKKLSGLMKAIPLTEKKLTELKLKEESIEERQIIRKRKKQWFEAFHWFYSSDGFLVISGRDAKSNEVIVKKQMSEGDLYFHADVYGAPHTVVKCENNFVPQKTLEEAAVFAAVFSRAWTQKIYSVDVYSVLPEQVSKKAPSGESIGSGAFMIYGKRNWFRKTPLDFAVGLKEDKECFAVVSGPLTAIEKQAVVFVRLVPGEKKKGLIAKEIKSLFEKKLGKKISLDLDELIFMLPAGGCEIDSGMREK